MSEQTLWEKAANNIVDLVNTIGAENYMGLEGDGPDEFTIKTETIIKRACFDYVAQETTRLTYLYLLATAQRHDVAASELSAAHSEMQQLQDYTAQVEKERDEALTYLITMTEKRDAAKIELEQKQKELDLAVIERDTLRAKLT